MLISVILLFSFIRWLPPTSSLFPYTTLFRSPDVAIVVSLSTVLVVVVGSMVGMLLPFLLNRFNMDPATASAPLITTIADVCGILIYLSIATAVLQIGTA